MNADKMRSVAFIGEAQVRKPIKGIVLNFHGLGDPGLRSLLSYDESEWADAGALVVMPYPGPWSWMNRQARAMVDELVDALYENFGLARSVPLLLTGGSMGGYCSLVYARYTKHSFARCAAIFPVCDLKHHFSERPDLPRTIYHAFNGYPEPMEDLFREHSPLDQADKMPRVPYFILHGDADKAVNKAAHSDRMVAAMRKVGQNVTYVEVPGMGHHEPSQFAAWRAKIDFIKAGLAK